jgi:putative ABC transport system permease protein
LVNFMMRIVVRTAGDPAALGPQVRGAVYKVDPEQPVSRMMTLEQLVSNSVAKPRFSLLLLGLFAVLALVLSIIGIYGITSYSVSQRTREVGLRMALGAEPKGIVQMIVGETGLLAGLGIVIGLAAAYALSRVMASLLYGVAATDPVTFVSVALGLALVALIAAYLPGRRATRVSPVVALRTE